MNVNIKELGNDQEQIEKVQKFLFKMIKKEFGYDYIPEWHADIVNIEEYYVIPERNAFFVAYSEEREIIGTIGIRAYDKDFEQFRGVYSSQNTTSIWRLFIDERYRRFGLATKIYSIAEKFAKEKGFSDIYLHTHRTLPGALQYWMKMGFTIKLDEHDELETIHMDKHIRKIEISPQAGILNYAIKL